jgi:hypothetical protein
LPRQLATGDDQRPHQTGAIAHPNRKVRDALVVQIAQHARVGDQVVRQHHQNHGGGPTSAYNDGIHNGSMDGCQGQTWE